LKFNSIELKIHWAFISSLFTILTGNITSSIIWLFAYPEPFRNILLFKLLPNTYKSLLNETHTDEASPAYIAPIFKLVNSVSLISW